MVIRIINELVFDRSDPDEIVSIRKGGQKITRLEDLRDQNDSELFFIRGDIGMVNAREAHCKSCTCEDHNWTQFLVYATTTGELTGEGLKYMSQANINQCREIATRLVAIAKVHPEFKTYLKGY